MLGNLLVNVSASTRAGIKRNVVELGSALSAGIFDTMGLTVFRSQNWIKSLRIRIFRRAVSFLSVVILDSDFSKGQELILVSGCTSEMFCDKDIFVGVHDVSSKRFVIANNIVSPVKGQGFAKISCFTSELYLAC